MRDTIHSYVDTFLTDQRTVLEHRVAEGRIRDRHGDLHTGSVCVAGRRLYLFDCIEFNQCFRCADVAAEVAFLAMGLAHLGRADLAGASVDAYIAGSRDVELRKLLNFHTCYRAYVRGKGLSFRPDEPDLCHLLACLGGRPPGLSIQVFLVAGHIAEEIGRFAVEHRSDAIVLVRRSHLEVGRARVLRAVLDRTPCPCSWSAPAEAVRANGARPGTVTNVYLVRNDRVGEKHHDYDYYLQGPPRGVPA